MAKYKAHPFYIVDSGRSRISFNHNGFYETQDRKEIDILDKLCPTWVKRLDDQLDDQMESEKKAEEKQAEKKVTVYKRKKTSAK
ncbi:hypothetical protein [Melghirimyces algeriensis]|uniref:Uncharacterized protein n=1 Tax=Melghirimyces algeriensis TaxID=910412 RepID=A0A521FA41_9BACL|nr:hypothetical protein [Melghirimyces algeriensis]SMO93007.1 hypothetical protein SAMN06264849_11516 [Melghirimyces algeriensis]